MRTLSLTSCLLVCALGVHCSLAASAQSAPADDTFIEYGYDASEIPPPVMTNVTPPRVVELLTLAFETERLASRRAELVRDLGRCGTHLALAAVVKAMSDSDAMVRAEAARAAGGLGDTDALPALRRLLSDPELSVRIEAIKAGAGFRDPSFVAAALKDTNELMFSIGCSLSLPEHHQLIAEQLPGRLAGAKVAAITALSVSDASKFADLIARQIDEDVPSTIAGLDALRAMKAADQLHIGQKSLGHIHPAVRRAAVQMIAVVASRQDQIDMAARMLADDDPTVRIAAVGILIDHPSSDLVPVLVQQLAADHPGLCRTAREALTSSVKSGIQQAVDAAVVLLDDPNPRRREDGSYILGHARNGEAISRHIKLLDDRDLSVVAQAAESLGWIGNVEASPRIAALLDPLAGSTDLRSMDPAQANVIGQAFIACARLGYQAAFAKARVLVPDKIGCPITIRAPAIWAAGMLGNSQDTELADALLSVFADTSPFEVELARFEAVKAIGNLGYLLALPRLRMEATQNPVGPLRWMAHLAADHLDATQSDYQPLRISFVAETCIKDLADPSKGP